MNTIRVSNSMDPDQAPVKHSLQRVHTFVLNFQNLKQMYVLFEVSA